MITAVRKSEHSLPQARLLGHVFQMSSAEYKLLSHSQNHPLLMKGTARQSRRLIKGSFLHLCACCNRVHPTRNGIAVLKAIQLLLADPNLPKWNFERVLPTSTTTA